ncbi:MAG: XrtA/PEP-CTERM system TPR-repeat protein PrsT, partial [Alphaproteobacteria bacterium]
MTTGRFSLRLYLSSAGVFAAALVFALGACDDAIELSEEEYIERAQEHRLAGKLRASVIELKNALQANPESAPARWLLGQLYVDIGQGAAAEKELMRSRDLGMDGEALLKPLGRAWLLQGKFKPVLEEIAYQEHDEATTKAAVLVLHGLARLGLGRPDEAETAFREALEHDPEAAEAYAGLARAALLRRDLDQAEAELARAGAIAPEDPDVLTVKGDVAFLRGDYAGSAAAFETLLKTRPDNLGLQIALARAQIGTGNLEEAAANLDRVLKVIPNHPATNYLRALAAFRAEDYETAINYTEAVLRIDGSHLPSLLIAGAGSYALGRLEQANKHLTRFLADVPGHRAARRLLGATQLRIGRADEAVATLDPLLDGGDEEDATLLAMIGTAAVRSGDLVAGSEYFQRAAALRPEAADIRTQLGLTRIALGQRELGIEDLEQAIEIDPGLDR